MADRGRDLTISVLSDVERFDLDKPAQSLEDVSRKADDTGRSLADLDRVADRSNLDALEKDAKAGADGLDKLEAAGESTAKSLSDSFDRIKRESKQANRAVEDDASHTGDAVRDSTDEIKGEALEGAASFDGSMDSIADSAQSAAAMALSAFGPLGVGIGVAAAGAYGLFRAQTQKAKEAVTDLVDQMIADGGRLSSASVLAKIQEFAKDGSILDLKKQAEDARIPVSDYINALAGDANALDRSTAAIRDRQDALAASATDRSMATQDEIDMAGALDDAAGKLSDQAEQARTARDAVDALNGVTKEAKEANEQTAAAVDAHAAALDAFVDPVTVYTDLLATKNAAEQATAQATADATSDQTDSWEDYVKDVDLSVDDYLDALEKQVKAQEDWADNLGALAKRGVDDGVLAELERMGPEGAPLVAKLTKSSDAELQRMVALYGRQGAAAGKAVAEGIVDQTKSVNASAAALHSGAARIIGGQINIPVGFEKRFTMSDAERLRYDIANQIGTVVVPVKGQSPYTNNANNSKYRW